MRQSFKTRLRYSDVTPQSVWIGRRALIAGAGSIGAVAAFGGAVGASTEYPKSRYSVSGKANSLEDITSYNNFYEFGTKKDDPAKHAHQMTTDPWSIKVDGLVEKPGQYDLADLLAGAPIEERIYRLRCVEGWSMIIPWIGFELSHILNRIEPSAGAKYVSFETLVRPSEMKGQNSRILDWPYREGLRLDEAMHPLTIMATGLYGEELPNQNGAPLRLVVPWKYGFKSIKSIVRITVTEDQPPTSWNMQAPNEYGFYSNVNPDVDHPRWSQATERVIGGGLFAKRVDTQLFNGYGDEVASLYAGMDLAREY